MRKYRIKQCAVCGQDFEHQEDIIECTECHTIYDLVNGEIDNSKTLVEPMDCKHRKWLFVQSASGSGQSENVTICADCGEMKIFGRTAEGREPFSVRIVLWSQELVNAIGKAARHIPDQPGFEEQPKT